MIVIQPNCGHADRKAGEMFLACRSYRKLESGTTPFY
jgi:hypothetical protein